MSISFKDTLSMIGVAGIVSPTNPENLVKGCGPVFLVDPLENMQLLYKPYVRIS